MGAALLNSPDFGQFMANAFSQPNADSATTNNSPFLQQGQQLQGQGSPDAIPGSYGPPPAINLGQAMAQQSGMMNQAQPMSAAADVPAQMPTTGFGGGKMGGGVFASPQGQQFINTTFGGQPQAGQPLPQRFAQNQPQPMTQAAQPATGFSGGLRPAPRGYRPPMRRYR